MPTCLDCYKNCPYFPDMSCDEWDYDEEKGYKVRRHKKQFKCIYNYKPLKWDKECPRAIREEEEDEIVDVESNYEDFIK